MREEVDVIRAAYPQFDQQLAAMAAMYEVQTQMSPGWEVLILPAVADAFAGGYEAGWDAASICCLYWGDDAIPGVFVARGRQPTPDGLGFVLGWSDYMIAYDHKLAGKALADVLRWRLAVWRGFRVLMEKDDDDELLD